MSENNKTDFAELKEKLTKFDVMALSAEYIECCKRRQYNGLVRIEDMVKWQHSKDSAIISELIEIIKLQNVTIDSICTTHSDDCADADEEFSEDETCECGYISIVNNKKETTTRLQKLRDGK